MIHSFSQSLALFADVVQGRFRRRRQICFAAQASELSRALSPHGRSRALQTGPHRSSRCVRRRIWMGRHRHLFVVLSLGLPLILIVATARHARGAAITQNMMVGSRPPSCAGRCWWCVGRRCEAVQVPITPQEEQDNHGSGGGGGGSRSASREASSSASSAQHEQRRRPSLTTSSYDDHSNYKPLSWRCKCGGG